MASTYVNNLRLNEMATGDESGNWGVVTNLNLDIIGQAWGYGTRAIANASTDNITIADGALDADRNLFLKLTGGGQACTITLLPNTVSKAYLMENATSYTLTFTSGSGANVAILAGQTKLIASDGGGGGGVMYDLTQDLAIPDLFVDNDIKLQSDSAVLGFGADNDTTLTHTDGTGLTLNSTNKICFNDASQFVQGSSGTVLSIGATDEIDLTATAIDLNGTLDVSGTLTQGGASQFNSTITVGADDTGYDVKLFGATASAYLLWDESADKLLTAGGALVDIVKDKLMIGGTAVTTTAAELNKLDGATLTTTELNYVDGVTSAIQTQIDTKTSTGKAIAMAMVFG
tara:strand:- start:1005 stop:2039 length:1035 start_codon:yes stop_codon:yes gene_type:complete